MGFSRFGFSIGVRLILILLSLGITGLLLVTPGYPVAMFVGLVAAVILSTELFTYVAKTNREVARFLDAARYADFGQRFEFSGLGAGFVELGETFTFILDRFRQNRSEQEAELRHLKALLEHVPVPLLSVRSSGQVTLWNNAARRLFGSETITRITDFATYGKDLPQRIQSLHAGERILLTLHMENQDLSFSVGASEISIAANTERLISLQNIQSELDVKQLQAWQDLVRVLTHEIMNSITPVLSLAKTAADLVDDVSKKVATNSELVDDLKDVKDAVDTVARRSDGLMKFVSSYRQLTRLPELNRTRFLIADLFSDVARMTAANWSSSKLKLVTRIEPDKLDLVADRQMVEQVLINLLQNAYHAVTDTSEACIELVASLNRHDRVTIEVLDNGPGIAPDIADGIFVPFYTTRKEGSGVGLALSRQLMIANGGTITFTNRATGGARFSLSF